MDISSKGEDQAEEHHHQEAQQQEQTTTTTTTTNNNPTTSDYNSGGGRTSDDSDRPAYDTDDEEDDEEEEESDEPNSDAEINDASLLRSMLQDSEDYYRNLAETEASEEKQCWVCFATEEDDLEAVWVHPCRCRGTTKWVHQACIQRWVDEKQKGNNSADVECPQCNTKYQIKFPRANFIVSILDGVDKLVQRLCPIMTGGIFAGSLYWTCVTYGAVTFMQAVGQRKGMAVMGKSDPLLLLVSLPLVPVGLVMGKMVRWEELVLKFLRSCVPKIPLSKYIMPSFAVVPQRQALQASLPPITDAVSLTRTFCGALFFPSIASFLGNALYKEQYPQSQLHRTIMGGFTFIAVKGVLKVYHKQHNFIRQCQRVILDHNELPNHNPTTGGGGG